MNLQTYEIKYQAIIDIENGIKNKAVANKYGVPQNTLSTWVKNKVSIKEKFLAADIGSSRKRDKKAKFPELENALIKWFAQVRSQNIPLSGEVVKLKAKEFATKLGLSDFESSTGWLDRFKERNNLSFKKVCGESKSVDSQSNQMLDWQTKLKSILQEYQPCDIYNADETGIFFRLLPDKTLEFKDVKCHGGKLSKDKLTVMVCSNMSGTDKLPLLVIGKSKNPRCFKNIKHIPVQYESNKTAWVTSDLFTTWVNQLDRKMSTKKRNIMLIVDNCPAHPQLMGLKSVKLVFLPPNTTSHTQPMDQGVIRNLKTHYRKLAIQRKLRAIDTSTDVTITVLDASVTILFS
ncbi:tigger transposable element-derived protein 4-like [Ylistrum balloti]|uniref:tigger transposable element-derived protein 4-like n=1 Tax=Ylistrum balloti TaxID=509963 RepID=UPI002905EB9F|nr:tigger transposable element-derived protein 4-like [Ylistrum balloti]